MSAPIISVRDLGKEYRLGATLSPNTLRDHLASGLTSFARGKAAESKNTTAGKTIWALKDINFDVQEGEVLGVIGNNGAGKSTLLKILSQITEPTKGEVRLRGRVASLLEVGTGFHGELSGRENIFLNGAILGMTRAEIRAKFDTIVDFSGVAEFIDTPVKRYSSGMKVRLAFAVAAHLDPEILLIDEVLAVGDAEFQKKCLGKMGDVARGGRTILFVSHNLAAIENLCSRALLLDAGALVKDGQADDVVLEYSTDAVSLKGDVNAVDHSSRVAGSEPIIQHFRILSKDGIYTSSVGLGEPFGFEIGLQTTKEIPDLVAGIHIYNWMGQRVLSFHTNYQLANTIRVTDTGTLRCRVESCNLMPGTYRIVVGLASRAGMLDRIDPVTDFEVVPRDFFETGKLPPLRDGVFLTRATWEMVGDGRGA